MQVRNRVFIRIFCYGKIKHQRIEMKLKKNTKKQLKNLDDPWKAEFLKTSTRNCLNLKKKPQICLTILWKTIPRFGFFDYKMKSLSFSIIFFICLLSLKISINYLISILECISSLYHVVIFYRNCSAFRWCGNELCNCSHAT